MRKPRRCCVPCSVEGLQDYGEKINAIGNGLRSIAPRVARFLGVGRRPAQQLFDRNAVLKQVVGLQKTLRTIEDLPQRHQSLKQNFEAMRDTAKAFTEATPKLITDAEQDVVADGVDDDEREAFFALVEDTDYNYSDAAAMDDEELEDVYTGEADVAETLGTVTAGDGDGTSGGGGGATCASGYREFLVDDKTSTCVWESLVEPNCYAGSRRVNQPDLGGSNACLYYSLDFFQPDGTCRENYAKATFQGRETCRWAELGTDKVAWYTLEKHYGVESPQTPIDRNINEQVGPVACPDDDALVTRQRDSCAARGHELVCVRCVAFAEWGCGNSKPYPGLRACWITVGCCPSEGNSCDIEWKKVSVRKGDELVTEEVPGCP